MESKNEKVNGKLKRWRKSGRICYVSFISILGIQMRGVTERRGAVRRRW